MDGAGVVGPLCVSLFSDEYQQYNQSPKAMADLHVLVVRGQGETNPRLPDWTRATATHLLIEMCNCVAQRICGDLEQALEWRIHL
jgi:hypothetical protein